MDETVTPLFHVPTNGDAMPIEGFQPTNKVGSSLTPKKYVEQDKKHTGVAGVARDVLGTLGDFLLTKLGIGPMYAPAQQKRRLAAAQSGFEQDPVGAIQQVTSIDPVFGSKLRDQYIDNSRLEQSALDRKETSDARIAIAQERAAIAKQLQDEKSYGALAGMVESMASWDDVKRAKNYGQMRAAIISNGRRMGLSPDELEAQLPAQFDEVSLDAFADRYVPVGKQRDQRLTRQRIDNQDAQADARDETTRRGQDIISGDKRASREVTKRGQNIVSGDKAASREVTKRGQDIRGATAGETATLSKSKQVIKIVRK